MKHKKFKEDNLIDRLMELIHENQYRISIVIICAIFFAFLIYSFVLANEGVTNVISFIKNPINWFIILVFWILMDTIKPLIREIWRQTDIRDKIEAQSLRKLELENAKMELELKKLIST